MASRLAEHSVVQQNAGHILAPRGSMQHLLETFVHHVAIALDGEDD